jgi:threonine/homoserine/homoserine lactone efflux protein
MLVLGLVFSAMGLVWLTGYAVLVARARAFFRRGAVARVLDGLTGVVLFALGLRVATER